MALSGLATPAMADQGSFIYNGSKPVEELSLTSQETHTLYETREYEDTCYRDEENGTRESCTGGSEPTCSTSHDCESTSEEVCRGVPPHEDCTPVTGTRCSDHESCSGGSDPVCTTVPNIVSVPYSCTKTETVAVGEELDYKVKGKVTVKFSGTLPEGMQLAESFTASLNGESAELATGKVTDQVLLFAKKSVNVTITKEKGVEAGEKTVDALFEILVMPIAPLKAPLAAGIDKVEMGGKHITYLTGKIAEPDFLSINLKLNHVYLLKRNPLLAQVEVPAEALLLSDGGANRTRVTIDLTKIKLTEPIRSAKYEIVLTETVKDQLGDRALLNPKSLGKAASVSKKSRIKLKLKK